MAWFHDFFGPHFWFLVEDEYTESRTAGEVEYLADLIELRAPGRRVVDLGCGTGRHAVGLSARGLDVIGVDFSAHALDEAARRSGADAVSWRRFDITGSDWQLGTVDAAVMVQSWGWETDARQLTLLRRLRTHLSIDGVLVLDFSNAEWIRNNFVPEARVRSRHGDFVLRRHLDASGTRCLGTVELLREGHPAVSYRHDFRLYDLGELTRLVSDAGFDVLQTDAEFTVDSPAGPSSRYIQIVARRRDSVRHHLAVALRPADEPVGRGVLDLRLTADEVDFCDPHPHDAWTRVATRSPARMRSYEAADAYGAVRLAAAFSRFHGVDIPPRQVFGGAGATGLLAGLAPLAAGGVISTARDAHPDLAAWALRHGAIKHVMTGGQPAASGMLVQVDRPDLSGRVCSLDEVKSRCAAAALTGATVIVDEVGGNYLEPQDTAIQLLAEVDNIIVLRSMSKGFCCGGLRVAVAACSAALVEQLDDLLPPLQLATVAVDVASELLTSPDPLRPLRARIQEVRPDMVSSLRRRGLEPWGDERLPWVFLSVGGAVDAQLLDMGILGRSLSLGGAGKSADVRRLSVPLSPARVLDLMDRLSPSAPANA